MFLEIISKLTSESLLSLYPVFVKNIGLPIHIQTWSRLFAYVAITIFFVDYNFVLKTMMTSRGLLLSFMTLAHIYTSYRGFQLLDSGVAYSIFYLYPIMILILSGYRLTPVMGLALLGVYLLVDTEKEEPFETTIEKTEKEEKRETFEYEGIVMILAAALTEAIIYFLVKDIKTFNNWNHIFISYFPGFIVLSYLFQSDIWFLSSSQTNTRLSWAVLINGAIGLSGYLLRFFSVSRLDTMLYAMLSYFGIVMSFVYGVIFNSETISLKKIVGAFLIIFSNWWLL